MCVFVVYNLDGGPREPPVTVRQPSLAAQIQARACLEAGRASKCTETQGTNLPKTLGREGTGAQLGSEVSSFGLILAGSTQFSPPKL